MSVGEQFRLDAWLADRARQALGIPTTPADTDPPAVMGLDDVEEELAHRLVRSAP